MQRKIMQEIKQVLRRPLAGLGLGFVAGVWLGLARSAPLFALLIFFGLCLFVFSICHIAAARLTIRGVKSRLCGGYCGLAASMFLTAGAFFAGWTSAVLRVHEPADLLLRNIMRKPQEGLDLRGIVVDEPCVLSGGTGQGEKWRFILQAGQVRRTEVWQPAHGRVAVTLNVAGNDEKIPAYGEEWQFFGVLTDASRYPIPAHGGKRPVWAWVGAPLRFQGFAADAGCVAEGRGNVLMSFVYALRRHSGRLLIRGIEDRPEVSGLLQALLLGRRQELSARWRDVFTLTGTVHVFAISGQHVMLAAGFLIFLLQAPGLSRLRWFWFLAPALLLYTLVTGMSPSALRGCIMALAFYAGPLCLRKPDSLSSLSFAAILILALDPVQLLSRGFILSFAAVAGLTIIYPEFARYAAALLRPDAFLAMPETLSRLRLRRAALYVTQLFCVSLAAWLATAPLCARWFHIVSPIGIFANLLVVPGIGLVLGIGFAGMLAGALIPAFASMSNLINSRVIILLVEVVSRMAKIPGGHFFVAAPPWWFVAGWYVVIFVWLLRNAGLKRWILAPLALALLCLAVWFRQRDRVEIEILHPIRQPVVLTHAPGSGAWLVDTGPAYQAFALSRLLRERGVNQLDWVLFTRLSAAHAGGVVEALSSMKVAGIGVPAGGFRRSPTWRSLETMADARRISLMNFDDGIGSVGIPNANFEVLYPPKGVSLRSEQAVLVLRLSLQNSAILIRADANPAIEEFLMKQPRRLKADCLILMDTAAASACGSAFLEAVSPQILVAAGLQPVRLEAKPAWQVEALEPGDGVRIICGATFRRIERFKTER